MRRREPAAPARQPGAVDMPSSSASSAKHGGGGRDAASRHVEDMAMEDLKDAINQVVLLQNVRGTLMDEIAQLKQRVATQAEAISVAEVSCSSVWCVDVCCGGMVGLCQSTWVAVSYMLT